MSFNVLITARTIDNEAIFLLENAGMSLHFLSTSDQHAEMRNLLKTHPINAILSRTLTLSADLLKLNPDLKIIARHGVGFDNVDIETATSLGIPVVNTPGTNAQSVAELVFGLLLSCARNLANSTQEVKQLIWDRQNQGLELQGKTLGLVGFGRIAQKVSNIAQGFGMEVIAYDPYCKNTDFQLCPTLESLLKQSDVVSLHCPAKEDGTPLLSSTEFSWMKKSAVLINTARGSLIDESALSASLNNGHIKAVGLDTLSSEPPAENNPLLKHQNIVFSPHIGGNTDNSLRQTATSAAKQIIDYLTKNHIDTDCLVNPLFKVHQTHE